MPIPAFDANTGNLPPGVHSATWDEIVSRFGWNAERKRLLDGLRRAFESLHAAGCRRAYLDGSFVTEKDVPGDFDGCWEAQGVDPAALDPVLLDFSNRRTAQKAKFGGELSSPTVLQRRQEHDSWTSSNKTRRQGKPREFSRSISEVSHDHQ